MYRVAAIVALSVVSTAMCGSAIADGTSNQYYIAMRIPLVDLVPRYVSASTASVADQATPFAGCDGNSYYLTSSDAAAVNSAIASDATVQLQNGASRHRAARFLGGLPGAGESVTRSGSDRRGGF